MNDELKVKDFLKDQTHMVIAITLDDGTPWTVPVTIKRYEAKEFEWDSHMNTVHSKAIESRPQMSMVTFQRPGDSFGQFGFYATGRGEIVSKKDDGFARYRFTVETAWINDETFKKREVNL